MGILLASWAVAGRLLRQFEQLAFLLLAGFVEQVSLLLDQVSHNIEQFVVGFQIEHFLEDVAEFGEQEFGLLGGGVREWPGRLRVP